MTNYVTIGITVNISCFFCFAVEKNWRREEVRTGEERTQKAEREREKRTSEGRRQIVDAKAKTRFAASSRLVGTSKGGWSKSIPGSL